MAEQASAKSTSKAESSFGRFPVAFAIAAIGVALQFAADAFAWRALAFAGFGLAVFGVLAVVFLVAFKMWRIVTSRG
jgi:hypothetical protein